MDDQVPRTDPASEIPDDGGIDLSAALQRLGGDQDLLRDMAAIFVEDAPGLLEQAQSGDVSEAAWRAAHSLKGLASNFSDKAADAANTAEIVLRDGDNSQIELSLTVLRAYVERVAEGLRRDVLE